MPAKVIPLSSLTGLMAIVTRRDVDEFAFLERQVIHEGGRSKIVCPKTLLDRHKDVDRGVVRGVVGTLRDGFQYVFDRGRPSAPFSELPGTGIDVPPYPGRCRPRRVVCGGC